MDSINFFELQDIGRRDEQQDSIANSTIDFDNGFRLHVLADGMGGHKSGSLASQMVCETFLKYFERNSLKSPEKDLKNALNYANDRIFNYIEENPDSSGMGTTVIALVYNEKSNQYSFLSVGDSPLYLYNADGLKRINENHAYYEKLKKMAKAGVISQEEADNDPQRHAVTSAVMGDTIKEVDVQTGVLQENEFLLLASDGIQTLDDSEKGEIAYILNKYESDIDKVLYKLIEEIKIKNNEYQDNTSLILIGHYPKSKTQNEASSTDLALPIKKPITTPLDESFEVSQDNDKKNQPTENFKSKSDGEKPFINKHTNSERLKSNTTNKPEPKGLLKYLIFFGALLILLGGYSAWSVYKCSDTQSSDEKKSFICNVLGNKKDSKGTNQNKDNEKIGIGEKPEYEEKATSTDSKTNKEGIDQTSTDQTSKTQIDSQINLSSNSTNDPNDPNDTASIPTIQKIEVDLTDGNKQQGNIFRDTDCINKYNCELVQIQYKDDHLSVRKEFRDDIISIYKINELELFKIKSNGQYEIKAKDDNDVNLDMTFAVSYTTKDEVSNSNIKNSENGSSLDETNDKSLATIEIPVVISIKPESNNSDSE